MFDRSVRATCLVLQTRMPQLLESAKAGRNRQILNLSPPSPMPPTVFSPATAES
jgi:hypothetical protein